MKIVIIGPNSPIPPVGWGAVESLIWDYKCLLEELGHFVWIVHEQPNVMTITRSIKFNQM